MRKTAVLFVLALSFACTDIAHALQKEQCPPVIFIKRQPHARKGTNGTMLGQINRNAKMGSAICLYDPAHPEDGCKTVFESADGFIFDMNLSYDAKKILFSFMDNVKRNIQSKQDSFHIWEINVDGTGLRQLTFGPFHDGSPVYLPDGRIVFCSTRVESFSLCQDYLAAAMYVIDPDGKNMRRLEYNTLCDTTPFVLDDGSILFTRWEYQDKNIFCVQGLWTLNPDGSRLQLFYGNTLTVPNSIVAAKQIPGTQKVICTMAAHHHLPIGAIAIIDRSLGLENPAAMRNITPDIPYKPAVATQWNKLDQQNHWQPGDVFYRWSYCDPYPVSLDTFLVSYGGGTDKEPPKQYSLYLLDDTGSKLKLYEDPHNSCFNPIPLKPRPLPHLFPGQVPKQPTGHGYFIVADIYQGLLDKGVIRGQVKQLIIMSQTPKKYNTEGPRYHDHYPIIGHGSYYVKYCYGTVPVDENGTAYFKAPAGVELYFIALDAHGKEIRRMGTITQITDGETQGCIGCHESRFQPPNQNTNVMKRLARAPDTITPPSWGSGPVSFVKQVQPVLDKYCVNCHSGSSPKARLDLSGDKSRFYNMAYRSLIDRKLVEYYYINPGPTGNFQPFQSGSWVSKLTKIIESNHSDINMADQDRRRIFSWIDANAPYYDTWDVSRPHTMGGRDTWHSVKDNSRVRPQREPWFAEFEDVFMQKCSPCHGRISNEDKNAWADRSDTNAWINLTNPQFSRVLNAHLTKQAGGIGIVAKKNNLTSPVFADTNDPTYQAMLSAIQHGKQALNATPRMDMPNGKNQGQQRNFGKIY